MRGLIVVLAAALGTAGVAAAHASQTLGMNGGRLVVMPATGTPSARFVVEFTTTGSTVSGISGGAIRTIELRATGSGRANACTNRVALAVSAPAPGLQRVTLSPGSGRARWCAGAFRGSVTETIRPVCHPGVVCPQYIAVTTIGTFSYKVT
jgi:hypothetical protein